MAMPEAATRESYYKSLEAQRELPRGFTGARRSISFVSEERGDGAALEMNLSLIAAEATLTGVAGVTTSNRFPGAPVVLAREILDSREAPAGVIFNNKVANVSVPRGLEDARRITDSLAGASGKRPWISLSTGVIGWRLPIREMVEAIPLLYADRHAQAGLEVAEAIMTTDRYPKLRRVEVGDGSILGVAKGAGMIEPNMATMLSVILTDLHVDPGELERLFRDSVERSYNRIGVDGEQSTSDAVLILSTGLAGPVSVNEFRDALGEVTGDLSRHIVRNGEGTGHVIRTEVKGIESRENALYLARRVSNSPLVKSALYGNDPNVGRVLMALGDGLSDLHLEPSLGRLTIDIGGTRVFEDGGFLLTPEKERALSESLATAAMDPEIKGYPQHEREVLVIVDFGDGNPGEVVWGSDLSYEYVRENADYRT